jgi:hypothetical protein
MCVKPCCLMYSRRRSGPYSGHTAFGPNENRLCKGHIVRPSPKPRPREAVHGALNARLRPWVYQRLHRGSAVRRPG